MKIIVTHMSPDWDAIGSVWLIRKFLPGWENASVQFVPAGERVGKAKENQTDPIEKMGEDEVIHVDTGLTPLDHHQTQDTNVSAASRTWDYVLSEVKKSGNTLTGEHIEAVSRIVKYIVATDHFKEVFWKDAAADYHEFSFLGLLEGYKLLKQGQDMDYVNYGFVCLDAVTHTFENRIWAEKEIREKGVEFQTKYGKAMGFETLNDTVLKLAQKMGYVLVVRKDPRKGYVRIKTIPATDEKKGIDLTLAYEQLSKIDPDATWFLHVSKKMLLNGTPKNPKMRPTKLKLGDIIKVLEKL
ncbi:MAG TPA: hypothetical protein VM077_02885 [Candidatus Limnocylindrales bacterium]|nr:hypothetical protein [Candidatus Limnocylindrales bacterium]